jgi:hypothetical protein
MIDFINNSNNNKIIVLLLDVRRCRTATTDLIVASGVRIMAEEVRQETFRHCVTNNNVTDYHQGLQLDHVPLDRVHRNVVLLMDNNVQKDDRLYHVLRLDSVVSIMQVKSKVPVADLGNIT